MGKIGQLTHGSLPSNTILDSELGSRLLAGDTIRDRVVGDRLLASDAIRDRVLESGSSSRCNS